METVYVAGHRNPDMDCTCAAYCYAALKNRLEPGISHVPIRSGPLSAQIRDVFEMAGAPVPAHFDSIAPWVGLVTRESAAVLHPEDPVLEAFRAVETRTISAIPVIEPQRGFMGMVGVNELVSFAMAQNQGERPNYEFAVGMFERVLPGRLVRGGVRSTFRAPIMTGSMPDTTAIEYLSKPENPPLLVVGNRTPIVRFAVERQFPALVITGITNESEIEVDLSGYEGAVFISGTDTVETIRLLRLSSPVRTIMDADIPRLQYTVPFEKAKSELINSTYRGLPVFDGDRYVGLVSRRSFIERPRPKLIMVDHNELSQAVPGAEHAEVLEIVDHHRLAPPSTTQPIAVTTRPVGSTCTLVYEEFADRGIALDRAVATLLLSGIVSDTVNLHSPTTTEADRRAIHRLESITGISASEHAKRLFSQITALESRDAREIVTADFKQYQHGGRHVGIGQVEVTTLTDSDNYRPRMLSALVEIGRERGLDWAMVLVTDVIKRNSILLTNGFEAGDAALTYERIGDCTFDLPGVLSRKKQLLPEVMRVIDDLKR